MIRFKTDIQVARRVVNRTLNKSAPVPSDILVDIYYSLDFEQCTVKLIM